MKKAEIRKLIKQENELIEEQENRNKLNHTQCLLLKKQLNDSSNRYKDVCDRLVNVTRKMQQARNVFKDFKNRLKQARGPK